MTKRLVAIDNRIGVTSVASVAMEWVELEATRLAELVRASFIAGPLADLERQNRNANEQAETDDMDATHDAAVGVLMALEEVYRGFTIIYLLTPFGVDAVAESNGKRVQDLRAFGSYRDEACRRLRNRIDNLLADGS